jgi:polyisoprenoid-binding protein YceI
MLKNVHDRERDILIFVLRQIVGFLAALPLCGQTVRFEVDRAQSAIVLRTDKAGLFSAFGHKHGILAGEFTATICADPAALENAAVTVKVAASSLRVDSAEARRAAGLPASGPSEKDIPAIQEKMLSAANLDARGHPEITFAGTAVEKNAGGLLLRGTFTLRGQSRSVAVGLKVTPGSGGFRFRGEFEIRQSDFGIRPESVGGVVKVADPVTILLDVAAKPGTEPCRR